ncbi:hypothetical protein YC2023_013322 [Brassica napus]
MVCAVSPSQSCRSETFSTLRFAQRAKAIQNKAVVNEVMQDDVNFLREVIRQLRQLYKYLGILDDTCATIPKQIWLCESYHHFRMGFFTYYTQLLNEPSGSFGQQDQWTMTLE